MSTKTSERVRGGKPGAARAHARPAILVVGLLVGVLGLAAGHAWAQEAPSAPLTRAAQRARHQALWATCRSCLIEPPAGPARAVAEDGAPPRRISPYADQSVAGLPAVAVVEGRVATVTPQLTADGRGVFTEYEVVVDRIAQNSALQPVTVGRTVLVTRPGGEAVRNGERRVVSVAGYPALAVEAHVVVTLLAVPDAGSFQELSLRPVAGKER